MTKKRAETAEGETAVGLALAPTLTAAQGSAINALLSTTFVPIYTRGASQSKS